MGKLMAARPLAVYSIKVLGLYPMYPRVNGHLHLPKLGAALNANFARNVGTVSKMRTSNGMRIIGVPSKFYRTRDNLRALGERAVQPLRHWREPSLPYAAPSTQGRHSAHA